MGKKKTSKEQKPSRFEDLPIVKLKAKPVAHNATSELLNEKKTWEAIHQAMEEGDREAVVEILWGYVHALGLARAHKESGLQKSTIQKAIRRGANPTIDTVMKLMSKVS